MVHYNYDDALLTELTAEQAAIVEGGLTVKVHSIKCLRAGADNFLGGKDDTFVISADGFRKDGSMAGTKIKGIDSGDSRTLNTTWRNSKSSLRIDLFDSDAGFSSVDHLGGFTATSTGGQIFSKEVSGSGSRYLVFYSAF